ncbi:YqkE family protein [Cohnella thermotolerans]|jgi:cell division septum initiation protein DivIVA|uniref:YqkE family protein n=1 Tax=Cohnella thermotolerans TaxID=329858 RepID=UPI00040C5ED7|nr:YqkE family protein [Cohnella thermotolerans]
MAKKRSAPPQRKPEPEAAASGATLKELLSAEVVGKLKAAADELKAEEASRKEQERKRAEAAREAERKRLENDFEYLLNNSGMDWKSFK